MAHTKRSAHRAPGGPDLPSRKAPAKKTKTTEAAAPGDGASEAAAPAPKITSQKTITTEQKNQTLDQSQYIQKGQRWSRIDGSNVTNADFPDGRWPEKSKPEPKTKAGPAPKDDDVKVIESGPSKRATRGTKPKPGNRAKPTRGGKPKAGGKEAPTVEPPKSPFKFRGLNRGPKGSHLDEATLKRVRLVRLQVELARDLLRMEQGQPDIDEVLKSLDNVIWNKDSGLASLVGVEMGPDGDSPATSPVKDSEGVSKEAADVETQGAEVDGTAEGNGAETSDAPAKAGSSAKGTRSCSKTPQAASTMVGDVETKTPPLGVKANGKKRAASEDDAGESQEAGRKKRRSADSS